MQRTFAKEKQTSEIQNTTMLTNNTTTVRGTAAAARTMESQLYENALILNNCGATLLRGGALAQAIETFRDAVGAMDFYSQLLLDPASVERSVIERSMTKVEVARDRLSNLVRNTAEQGPSPVESMSFEETLLAQTLWIVPVMRFDAYQVVFSIDTDMALQRDPEIDAAILIYNFGVAHLVAHNNQDAHSMFQLSLSIAYNAEGYDVQVRMESVVSLMIAGLQNLTHSSLMEGRIGDAEVYHEKIGEIIMTLLVVEDFLGGSAAAAA